MKPLSLVSLCGGALAILLLVVVLDPNAASHLSRAVPPSWLGVSKVGIPNHRSYRGEVDFEASSLTATLAEPSSSEASLSANTISRGSTKVAVGTLVIAPTFAVSDGNLFVSGGYGQGSKVTQRLDDFYFTNEGVMKFSAPPGPVRTSDGAMVFRPVVGPNGSTTERTPASTRPDFSTVAAISLGSLQNALPEPIGATLCLIGALCFLSFLHLYRKDKLRGAGKRLRKRQQRRRRAVSVAFR